jgi:hypothetical protein
VAVGAGRDGLSSASDTARPAAAVLTRVAYSVLSRAGGMFTNAGDNYQVISLVVEAEARKFVLSILFVSPHR